MKDTFCLLHNGGYGLLIYVPQMCTFSVRIVAIIRNLDARVSINNKNNQEAFFSCIFFFLFDL